MKRVKELPVTDKDWSDKLLKDGWNRIWEPRNLILAVVISFPFVLVLGAVILWLAFLQVPELNPFRSVDSFQITMRIDLKFLVYLVFVYLYMLCHELIHAVSIPNVWKSDNTVWGLNGLFGFTYTKEPLKKGRFLLVSVMPFVVLSVVPLFVLPIFGLLNGYTLGLCFINAVGSCVDFLNVLLVMIQVKKGSTMINNGFETFYKM